MLGLNGVTGGSYGEYDLPTLSIFGLQLSQPQQVFWAVLVVAAIVVVVCWWVGESPFGRTLKAVREDEITARSIGLNTGAIKVVVFAVSAGVTGLIGGFIAFYNGFVSPGSFDVNTSIFVIAAVVVGGSGNMFGVVIGAAVLASLQPILQSISWIGNDAIPWQGVIYATALIIIALARPSGLVPERARLAFWSRRHPGVTSERALVVAPVVAASGRVLSSEIGDSGATATASASVDFKGPRARPVSFAVDRIGESSPSIDSDTTATGPLSCVNGRLPHLSVRTALGRQHCSI
jgi:branched-chain amino acid transport system permease protein